MFGVLRRVSFRMSCKDFTADHRKIEDFLQISS
jgi:hypothetical protein